jgi:hypothetical protein
MTILDGRLEARAIISKPAQVGASSRVIDGGSEASIREPIGKVDKDRDLLGYERVAVQDGGHFPEWVDGEIASLALLSGLHVQHP